MSHHLVRSHTLAKSSLKTVVAAVVLSALAATPVFVQAAIQEPGAFAFYHPNLDVLNGGAPTPAARFILEQPAVICIAERLFERLTRSFLLSRIEPPEL